MSTLLFALLLGLPLAGAIVCAVVRARRVLEIATGVVFGFTFGSALWLVAVVMDVTSISAGNGEWYADGLSAYVAAIVSGSAFVVSLYSAGYLRRQVRRGRVTDRQLWLYYVLLHLFLFTMLLVLTTNNLGILWIGSEATTLSTALFVAFYERERSIEAAWKYVIICSVGIALALFGIILTYFSALRVLPGSGDALYWSSLMSVAKELDPAVLKLAFIFVLVGFGTKAGLAPMHTWKPDAYGEAPAPISALMSAGLVNVALYCLMRFYILVNAAVDDQFAPTLFKIFGLVSMGVAVPFILLQKDIKRMLAYSSVEHVGIIVFALGIGSPLAFFGALFHLLNNALAKTLLFLSVGNIRMAYHTKYIRKITGAIKVIPVSATLFLVGIFAITGWPPFGVFVSEITIVMAGLSGGLLFPTLLFVGIITTIFIGFIYHASRMVLGEPYRPMKSEDAPPASLVLLGSLLAALFLLGVYMPASLRESIQNAVRVLQG